LDKEGFVPIYCIENLFLLSSKFMYREFFNSVDLFTAQHFMATGALLAVRPIQILPMNQYA
jgi:hypothetical protein